MKNPGTFVPTVKAGDKVTGGDIIGSVQETKIVSHKIMVPNGVAGTVKRLKMGDFTLRRRLRSLKNENGGDSPLTLMQSWPVRKGRPYREKLPPDMPLVTGQRVIDTLVPHCQRRRSGGSGSLWLRKNCCAASAGQVGRSRYRRLHRMAASAGNEMTVF